MSEQLKELLDQHSTRASDVMNAHLTHTTRLVYVLQALVERNGNMCKALYGFAQAPSRELFETMVAANVSVCIKIDELLEAYRDNADDTAAIVGLVQDALKIIKVMANER